ncbi:hypothetical protein DL96DRAFT_1597573 [Flagelloscypha sp. PMI_526]|nr:hypothetical protein DL96DRAFT_1597573 [Flagelloscypha sp. PMI_526]
MTSSRVSSPTPSFAIASPRQQDLSTVTIQHIPPHMSPDRIKALFETLIGETTAVRPTQDNSSIDLTFSSRDLAKKALDLDGYSISQGTNLIVRLLIQDLPRQAEQGTKGNGRSTTKSLLSEFAAMFSQHGKVLHCVILATVDNSSRRRGFVVMASHAEAKRAMEACTNAPTKGGQCLDISWAVVQRSRGFLDGGDREVFYDSQPPPGLSRSEAIASANSPSSCPSTASTDSEFTPTPLVSSRVPTSILLFKNLPHLLFTSEHDLHPLLYPYGRVNKLELLRNEVLKGTASGSVAVVVEYAELDGALQALEALQGQCYAEHKIIAEFLKPSPLRSNSSSFSDGAQPSALSFKQVQPPSVFPFQHAYYAYPTFAQPLPQHQVAFARGPHSSFLAPYGYIPSPFAYSIFFRSTCFLCLN